MTGNDRIRLGTKAVSLAIQHRDLPPVRSQMCAGGCGRKAEQYHHYAGYEDWQLTDVIPLCRYCHSLADRIRNGEEVDPNLPQVKRIHSAIRQERWERHKRRLYLIEEYQDQFHPYRWLISRVGRPSAVILSDMDGMEFEYYLNSKQIRRVELHVECVLCGCTEYDMCSCPCHERKSKILSSEKFCAYCERILPISKFWKDKRTHDGYSQRCAECSSRLRRGEIGVWGIRPNGTNGYLILRSARPLKREMTQGFRGI